MSGTTIPLFSKRPFSFPLAANGVQVIIAVKAIDVSQYTSGTLEVRLHSHTPQANAAIHVKAYTTAPTPEDPEENFVNTSAAVASVTIDTQSAPLLIVDALDADFGGALMITVEGDQATAASTTFSAELSAFLTMKS